MRTTTTSEHVSPWWTPVWDTQPSGTSCRPWRYFRWCLLASSPDPTDAPPPCKPLWCFRPHSVPACFSPAEGVVRHTLWTRSRCWCSQSQSWWTAGCWAPANTQNVRRRAYTLVSKALVCTHLSHVSLGCEDDGLQAIVGHGQTLLLHHVLQPGQDLSIRQLGVTQHCTARLDRLNDLVRSIAGESKACRLGVNFHDSSQRLLGSICHTAGKWWEDASVFKSAR